MNIHTHTAMWRTSYTLFVALLDWRNTFEPAKKRDVKKKLTKLNIPAKITNFFFVSTAVVAIVAFTETKNPKGRERKRRINLKIVSRNVEPNALEWRITDI